MKSNISRTIVANLFSRKINCIRVLLHTYEKGQNSKIKNARDGKLFCDNNSITDIDESDHTTV